MRIMGIDFETTGADREKDRPIEVGYVVWDEGQPGDVARASMLMKGTDYPKLSEEINGITGITDEMLDKDAVDPALALGTVCKVALEHKIDAFLAHNKQFDKTIFRCELARHPNILLSVAEKEAVSKIPWRCTLTEIDWPTKFRCKQLSHLVLDHGQVVDPTQLHRAENDVDMLRRLTELGPYTIAQMKAYAEIPWVYIQAIVPHPKKDNGKGKDEAKAAGFGWEQAKGDYDGPKFPKTWVYRVKENKLDEFKAMDLPFKRKILERR